MSLFSCWISSEILYFFSASVRTRRAKTSYSPNSSPKKGKSPQKNGHQSSSSKRKASKITPETKTKVASGTGKKQKLAKQPQEQTSTSFHMSQTQNVGAILPSFDRRSPGQNNGPLSSFSEWHCLFFPFRVVQHLTLSMMLSAFFYSGIDPKYMIEEKIKRLGGKVIDHQTLTFNTASRKVFFLGDYDSWRKMKYILAASLGAPMLYYRWIEELEQKHQDQGAKAFDSELFIKYRLPLGLDLEKGYFPLQRASNARYWDRPGCSKMTGNPIFDGITVALAIPDQSQENDWYVCVVCFLVVVSYFLLNQLAHLPMPLRKKILTILGATVKTQSDLKGKGKVTVDCCLLASTTLPPHVVSIPQKVSKLVQSIDDDTPLLDLAWAHQSIIQRKRLPFSGDPRYSVSLEYERKSTCQVFSIKSKSNVRYEVGDLVEFNRGSKSKSQGRIVSITRERQGKSKLEIQLMVCNAFLNPRSS